MTEKETRRNNPCSACEGDGFDAIDETCAWCGGTGIGGRRMITCEHFHTMCALTRLDCKIEGCKSYEFTSRRLHNG